MSRRRRQNYRSQELSELARQLLYAPPEKRVQVVRHAEHLHDELNEAQNYPLDFVVYRLTERRVPPNESVMLVGEAVRPDLLLLIDALSHSVEIPPDDDDPGETVAELSKRLGVSTKTIDRWRQAGLRWRWVVRCPGQMPTVVVQRSALSVFSEKTQGRVQAATSFNRISEQEGVRLIERARRLAAATDVAPQAIITHLAKRTGRSVEAVRLWLLRHDEQNPAKPVFAGRTGPLTPRQRRVIDRAYRRGVRIATICERFRKTRSTIYRAVYEARAERAREVRFSVVSSALFDRDDADEVILREIHMQGQPRRLDGSTLQGLPDELLAVYDQPMPPDATVRALIVRYNFLKHRARQAQEAFADVAVRVTDLDRFDALRQRAEQTRGEIIAGMLPVVLSVVRRQMGSEVNQPGGELLRLLYTGNRVLIDEIERFDAARTHEFESVFTNRFLRVLANRNDPAFPKETVEPNVLLLQLKHAGMAEPKA